MQGAKRMREESGAFVCQGNSQCRKQNSLYEFQINRNQMEYLRSQEKTQKTMGKKQAQSSRYMQSQRFIPPTHPAYVVTSNFEASHITHLQEEFDKNYIAMGMQTGKKKLMKMPDMPTDRFFIVADDSLGPPVLQGQFLTLNSKVVHYPRANNAEQVITNFKDYIGLGHFETSQQYYQIKDEQMNQTSNKLALLEKAQLMPSINQIRQNTIISNRQITKQALVASALQSSLTANNRSKIELREISTLREESKVSQGKLFIYENRKDKEQYRQLILELKQAYGFNNSITYIQRIDEYNNYLRLNRQHDNIILMSQYSFINLAQYFQKYKAFAVFIDFNQKINFYNQKNVALFTSNREKILLFVAKFIENKKNASNPNTAQIEKQNDKVEPIRVGSPSDPRLRPQKSPTTLIDEGYKSPSISLFNAPLAEDRPKQSEIVLKGNQNGNGMLLRANSPQNKHKIQLVRVTDLDKKQIETLKQKGQSPLQSNQPSMNVSPKVNRPPNIEKFQPKRQVLKQKQYPKQKLRTYQQKPSQAKQIQLKSPQPKQQELEVGLQSNIEEEEYKDRSQVSQRSKIKRLKSNKTLKGKMQFSYPNETSIIALPVHGISPAPPTQAKDNKKSNSLVKSHLRMGSDENHSRAHLKPKLLTHHRARSDEKQISSPLRVCINSPKPQPSNSQKSESEFMQPLGEQNQQKFNLAQFNPINPQREEKGIKLVPKENIIINQRRPSILKSKTQITLEKQKEQEVNIAITKIPPKVQDANNPNIKLKVNCPPPRPNNSNEPKTLQKSRIGKPRQEQQQSMKAKIHINPNRPKDNCQQKRYSFRKATFTQQQKEIKQQILEQEKQQMNFFRKNSTKNTHRVAANQIEQQVKINEDTKEQQLLLVAKPKEKEMQKLHNNNRVKAAEDYYTTEDKPLVSPAQPTKVVKPTAVPPIFQINQFLSNDQIDIPQISSEISSIKNNFRHQRKSDKRPTFGSNQMEQSRVSRQKDKEYGLEYNMNKSKEEGSQRALMAVKKNTTRLRHNQQRIIVAQSKIDSSTPSQQQESTTKISNNPTFPKKSRSLSQVNRIFNKSKVQPAVDRPFAHRRHPSSPRSNRSEIERRPSTVGKIFSNLNCRPATSNLQGKEKDNKYPPFQASSPTPYPYGKNSPYMQVNSGSSFTQPPTSAYRPHLSQDPYISKAPCEPQTYRCYKNKSIEDLIDLSKYDRVVENGIVVYRSKYPIQTTYYSPSTINQTQYSPNYYQPFKEIPPNIASPTINIEPKTSIISPPSSPKTVYLKQNPYLIDQHQQKLSSNPNSKDKKVGKASSRPIVKQSELKRSKSGVDNYFLKPKQVKPNIKVQYKGDFMQQNVGVQCQADPLNSLVNINNQQLLQKFSPKAPLPNASKIPSKSSLRQAIKSTINPIQDLLASKISNSKSVTPQLILNMESPNHMADSNELSQNEDEQSIHENHNELNQKLILYLIDKTQPTHFFDKLNTLKTKKDSLITFKNQKQLSQQLLQTTHIYDIIYVLPLEHTKPLQQIIKSQPNCFTVEVGEGKTKIKGNKIVVNDLQHLKDVTELLLKQNKKPNKPSQKRQGKHCRCNKQYMVSPRWQKGGCCHSYNVCCPVHVGHCHS